MLHNQLGRRNLNDYQRSEIALQLEEILKGQAKERQATSTGGTNPQLKANLPEAEEYGQTREAIAKTAGHAQRPGDRRRTVAQLELWLRTSRSLCRHH